MSVLYTVHVKVGGRYRLHLLKVPSACVCNTDLLSSSFIPTELTVNPDVQVFVCDCLSADNAANYRSKHKTDL